MTELAERKYYVETLAGAVSGGASLIVGHPFDTIKVRLQVCAPASPPPAERIEAHAALDNRANRTLAPPRRRATRPTMDRRMCSDTR